MGVVKREYQSMSHTKFVDTRNGKIYYVPNNIAKEMASEKDYDKRMAILARYRLNSSWSRFIRIVDGFDRP